MKTSLVVEIIQEKMQPVFALYAWSAHDDDDDGTKERNYFQILNNIL